MNGGGWRVTEGMTGWGQGRGVWVVCLEHGCDLKAVLGMLAVLFQFVISHRTSSVNRSDWLVLWRAPPAVTLSLSIREETVRNAHLLIHPCRLNSAEHLERFSDTYIHTNQMILNQRFGVLVFDWFLKNHFMCCLVGQFQTTGDQTHHKMYFVSGQRTW